VPKKRTWLLKRKIQLHYWIFHVLDAYNLNHQIKKQGELQANVIINHLFAVFPSFFEANACHIP
jgi:hypothetical protein